MNTNENQVTTQAVAGKETPAPNRNQKDTLFRMIFKEPKELLSLYNAIHGTTYTNPEDLRIVTLENSIYMSMKNDLACIVDCRLSLYEHQSSVNPNMPLRDLFYVAKEYEKLITGKTLYASTLVRIPAPSFITFYNGKDRQPERLEMKLSDAFEIPVDNPALELRVIQLNINAGYNTEFMEKCRTLREYAIYVERLRKYMAEMPLEEAVEQAVQECISENILSEFLTRYRREAVSVSIFEYDEEKEMALIRKDERDAGRKEGRQQGEETFASLTARLLADSRTADLSKATTDKTFRNMLYREYGILNE